MFKRLFLGVYVFGMAALAPPATATANCADRQIIVDRLASAYSETLKAVGLQTSDQVFEIWSSDSTGTWTILLTISNGTSCVMASGSDFEAGFPEKLRESDPSS